MRFIAAGSRFMVVLAVGMAASVLFTLLLDKLVLGLTHAIGPDGWVAGALVLVTGLGLYRRSMRRHESEIAALASDTAAR